MRRYLTGPLLLNALLYGGAATLIVSFAYAAIYALGLPTLHIGNLLNGGGVDTVIVRFELHQLGGLT